MRTSSLLLPLLLLSALPAFAQEAEPAADAVAQEQARRVRAVVVDRVVATVAPAEGRGHRRIILTLSDLELESRIALMQRGATAVADSILPDDTLAASLEWLIAEHLLLAEAEQLGLAAVEAEEVAAAIEGLRARFDEPTAFDRFVDAYEAAEDLPRILRRRIVVDRYLASRLKLAGGVSEDEVLAAWEERRDELGGMSLQEAKAPLRASLEKEQRETIVKNLVSDLRDRAEVRILHKFRKGSP